MPCEIEMPLTPIDRPFEAHALHYFLERLGAYLSVPMVETVLDMFVFQVWHYFGEKVAWFFSLKRDIIR